MRAWMGGLLVVGMMVSGSVFAQTCPGGTTRVTGGTPATPNGAGNFTAFITGATVCAARGNDRWQEFHATNLDLIDFKLGSNPVDPTEKVGTWTASNGNTAVVTHTYGTTSYIWAICLATSAGENSTYTLVSPTAGTVTGARVIAGQRACPP